jgi:hypothetical protein
MGWVSLAANGLWIVGCALALAVLSGVAGMAQTGSFRERLGQPLPQMGLGMAFFLICAGQVALAVPLWEKMIWSLLGLAFLMSTWHISRKGSGATSENNTNRMKKS